MLTAKDLVLDQETKEVKRNDKQIYLTKREYELLEFMLLHKNEVMPREMMLSHVWHYTQDVDTRVVDVYIGYLRRKIDKDYSEKIIQSIKGFGYLLKD